MVAEAFIPNPDNLPEVDHIDTIKENNCVENLRWCTHSQNHLNPLTVKLRREINTGKHLSEKTKEKLSKKIAVFKDGVLIHIFKSYKDLDDNSESIIGKKLWNVYARKVARGEREEYNGFTFQLV